MVETNLVKLTIAPVENDFNGNVCSILDPTDPRFAKVNVEAREAFPARLEEVHSELFGTIGVIEIAEIGGIRNCRDEDSDWNIVI